MTKKDKVERISSPEAVDKKLREMSPEMKEVATAPRYSQEKLAKVKMDADEKEVQRLIRMDNLLHRLEVKKGQYWIDLGPLPVDVAKRLVKYLRRD